MVCGHHLEPPVLIVIEVGREGYRVDQHAVILSGSDRRSDQSRVTLLPALNDQERPPRTKDLSHLPGRRSDARERRRYGCGKEDALTRRVGRSPGAPDPDGAKLVEAQKGT